MTAERFAASPGARRAAALLILLFCLWAVAPLFAGPLDQWLESRQSLADETAVAARLARLEARRSAIGALAAKPGAPFLAAPDAVAALGMLVNRVIAAAPPGAMRLEGVTPEPVDDKPGMPMRVRFTFVATQGAFYAFLSEIETRAPLMRIDDLVVSPVRESDGSLTLAGTGTVSAVALIRAAAQ